MNGLEIIGATVVVVACIAVVMNIAGWLEIHIEWLPGDDE